MFQYKRKAGAEAEPGGFKHDSEISLNVNSSETEEEDEEEEEETIVTKKIKKSGAKDEPFSSSTLRIKDIYDEFETLDPQEIDKKFRPPYAKVLDNNNLDELVDWERKRIQNQKRLRDNPMYQFVQLVASFSNTNIKQYIQSENAYTGGSRSITAPSSTNAAVVRSPLNSPPGGLPITPGRGPVIARNPALIGKERTIWDLLEDDNFRNGTIDSLKKSDMAYSLDWLSDPQVHGIMDISPVIYSHTLEAYQHIQDQCTNISYLSLEELASHGELRTRFARLVAILIDLSKFLAPTRSQLDKNFTRLMHFKSMLIYDLNKYEDKRRINRVFGGIQNSSNILGNRTFSNQSRPVINQLNFQGFYP